MPYPNEHACRLRQPNGGKTRRKNGAREHNGKKYDVIYQESDDGSWEEQAYRYPKGTWGAAEARSHCKSHDGITFEPASEGSAMSAVRLLERDEWVKACAALDPSCDECVEIPALRKGFGDVVKGINAETRQVNTVISSGAQDRDNDVINPKKWSLKHYKKNPVVQWAHDHDIPAIAQSPTVKLDGDILVSTDQFPEEGMHPFADMIFNLVAGKFIRAKSVGFKPERGKFAYEEELGGYRFEGQELLEHSYVNVPSNPEALVGAKHAGIDLKPMVEWAQKVLDGCDGPGMWLPKHLVERALQIADDERRVIPVNGFKLVPASQGKHAKLITEIEIQNSNVSVEELNHKLADALPEVAGVIQHRLADTEPDDQDHDKDSDMRHDHVAEEAITACPACGEDHEAITVITYAEPVAERFTHWGLCPVKGPHLVKVVGNDEWVTTETQKGEEPEEGITMDQLLGALLDSSEPTDQDDPKTFTDQEVDFLGQALREAMSVEVREAVRQRMTAMTGRLD
jgi:hypothetical protein